MLKICCLYFQLFRCRRMFRREHLEYIDKMSSCDFFKMHDL